MTTNAKPTTESSSHYYHPDGRPCYEVENKSKGGMRKTNLNDARRLGLLPSVTTILSVLDKPGLTAWKIEQAVLAAMTTPRLPGEQLDAFVERVLHTERVQDQESQAARDRGTEIHNALEAYFTGREVPEAIRPWIMPAAQAIAAKGELVATEKVLVGHGYAGKTDLVQRAPDGVWWLWDWKSAKKLPDPAKGGAWSEHVLQLSAYARAYMNLLDGVLTPASSIRTGNIYISTVEQGKFVVCEHGDWLETYQKGFAPLVQHWQWANRYQPQMKEEAQDTSKEVFPWDSPPQPRGVIWTEGVKVTK